MPGILSIVLMLGIAACSRTAPTPDAKAPADTTAPAPADPWTLTEEGIGPYHVGMTLAEARAAGDGLTLTDTTSPCYYARPKSAPAGISLMMTDGHIARINVDSTTVATAAGARVGDTEERIRELYPGKVEVTPHKYTPGGHYMTVTPGAGDRRIVFETDGKTVLRFRGGKLPEVGWIEGCS
jgi:hypothetical protein